MTLIPLQLKQQGINFVLLEKKGKRPFQKNWTNLKIDYNNTELLSHEGNYGVMGGGEKNLVIIDFDNAEVQEKAMKSLPETFTVKTGSGLLHLYYYVEVPPQSFKGFDENMETLYDVQGVGKQVVGPGSIHPNGNPYHIVNEKDIQTIAFGELKATLAPFNKKKTIDEPKEEIKNVDIGDDFIKTIKNCVSMEDVLTHLKIDTQKNPTDCPMHNSKGGKCLGFREETAHCFHCEGKWNIFTLIKDVKDCSFKESLDVLASMAGLTDILKKSRDEYKAEHDNSNDLENINLPGTGKLVREFVGELIPKIKNESCMFFRPDVRDIIEITKIKNETSEKEYTGFVVIKPNRFINIVEQYVNPGYTTFDKEQGPVFKRKSMGNSQASVVLENSDLQTELPMLERIFQVPIPILYKDKLTFPKRGYDKRFNSWLPFLAPEIQEDMPLKKAKTILENVYKGFCFKDEQDRINAYAGLLTPFLKGIYPSFNTRPPAFSYNGNRERVGKDYCAGITGIVYEGEALEEPPISSNEKHNNNNEEFRKKIMAAFLQGRKRFHSSNNKGYINNAVLESFLTLASFSDRLLGKNEMCKFDNEIDFSMSGNIGTTMTPDLANRCINVNLFFDKEDANAREFEIPNLHQYIKDNRGKMLSALYALVKNWIDNGSPKGKVLFSSYPDWARICGGIMECAELGNPCVRSDNGFLISNDSETGNMIVFFEMMHEAFGEKWITAGDIKEFLMSSQDNPFHYLDFTKRSDQTKFGIKLSSYVGRFLSDIKLLCNADKNRASRSKYLFTKEKQDLSTLSTLSTFTNPKFKQDDDMILYSQNVDNVDNVDKKEPKKTELSVKDNKKCPKCNSNDIIEYPNNKYYCKKCRKNYNGKKKEKKEEEKEKNVSQI